MTMSSFNIKFIFEVCAMVLRGMAVFIRLVIILTSIKLVNGGNTTLTIGYAFPWSHDWQVGPSIGSAFVVGLKEVENRQILPGYTIKWLMRDSWCKPHRGMTVVLDIWREVERLDAIIGPGCSVVCEPVGLLAAALSIPVISPSCGSMLISDKSKFPTLTRTVGPMTAFFPRIASLITDIFGWDRVGIITTTDDVSKQTALGLRSTLESEGKQTIFYVIETTMDGKEINYQNLAKQIDIVRNLKDEARIIFMLGYGSDIRNFLISAYDEGMMNGEYAFIGNSILYLTSISWDYRPDMDSYIYQGLIDVSMRPNTGPQYDQFAENVIKEFQNPRFENYSHLPLTASISEVDNYAGFLHDAVLLWAYGLNKTIEQGGAVNDGYKVTENIFNMAFKGITGNVKINDVGDRTPDQVIQMYQGGHIIRLMDWYSASDQIKKVYKPDEPDDWSGLLWPGNASQIPSSFPECGWKGELCHRGNNTNNIILISIGIVISCCAVLITALTAIAVKKYRFESALKVVMDLKVEWGDIKVKDTIGVKDKSILMGGMGVLGHIVVKIEPLPDRSINIKERRLLTEIKEVRELTHECICQFVGFCSETPYESLLFMYAERGSLQDLINDESLNLSWDFKVSLLTDVAYGMRHLHQSVIGAHGRFASDKCVVDSRWTCKITGHGLDTVRSKKSPSNLLWKSPEVLRHYYKTSQLMKSKAADVYSFSVVMQEIMLENIPFAKNTPSLPEQDILNKVVKCLKPPYRPDITDYNIPTGWKLLMTSCWSEDPEQRPDFEKIIKYIHHINNEKATMNLVDRMIRLLEMHTQELENRVTERCSEIEHEKSKTEMVLNELLPPSIAKKLTAGLKIEPETFHGVTIFFSDIVGFTRISSRATPLQVVNMLNGMYTLFDDVALKYDVFKVTTIGDAYMVASGVPIRNGDRHASEICKLAVALLESVRDFPIDHMPGEFLRLRIGIHTGPCVGGVTGIKMPRFLLFGETVDIAAKMESQGEPMRVHISKETRDTLLMNKSINEFNIERRDHTPGGRETFWLHK